MQTGQFSRTAIVTAAMRAAHQIEDGANILVDPLAGRALVEEDEEALRRAADPAWRPLRLFVALRSRIAEDVAREAVQNGARQIVVLGAGFDTFSHRAPDVPGLKIFEVDHPATQREKRRRFALNRLDAPARLTYAVCDFDAVPLADALAAAGFDPGARTAFLWLGVAPYLTAAAVEDTLRFIVARPGDVVFDYANPAHAIEDGGRKRFQEEMAARVARAGEPFRSHFDTPDLHRRLAEVGFDGVKDWGPRLIAERLGAPANDSDAGGHILHAWRR